MMEFRDYFSGDPSVYEDAIVDQNDDRLEYGHKTAATLRKWQDPNAAASQ